MAGNDFKIVLKGVDSLPHHSRIVKGIRSKFAPIARRAGKTLKVEVDRGIEAKSGDVSLLFSRKPTYSGPGVLQILGDSSARSGTVYVDEHLNTRIGGGVRPLLYSRQRDHTTRLQTTFDPDDPKLADHIANTAVHELGHMLTASANHSRIPGNVMNSSVPNRRWHDLQKSRKYWGTQRGFSKAQVNRMVGQIRSGNLGTPGFNVTGGFQGNKRTKPTLGGRGLGATRGSRITSLKSKRIGSEMLRRCKKGRSPYAGNVGKFSNQDRNRHRAYMRVGINPLAPGVNKWSGKPYAYAGDFGINEQLPSNRHIVFDPMVITRSNAPLGIKTRSRPFRK